MSQRTRIVTLLGLGVLATGCPNPEVGTRTFFSQRIQPILEENCVSGTANAKCHVESDEAPGQALGNLDLSSFEAIHKRPELLSAYGTYPEAVMLMKAVKPDEVIIQYAGAAHNSEIFHAGGAIFSRDTQAFVELQQWLKNGATEDGQPPDEEVEEGVGECVTALRPDIQPFLGQAQGEAFDRFRSDVQPILAEKCSFGSCHGSSQSDFYLTCGNSDPEIQHNYIVTQSFVSAETDRSEILLRPLSPNAGGVDHTGGEVWGSSNDNEFRAVREWAALAGPLVLGNETPEYTYYAERVMPALLRRGCAMPQCHSPQGFNDFRLRAGSRGFFSPLSLRRNYDDTRNEFVSLDSPDPNESRILKKNIAVDRGGILHRAGITALDIAGADDGGNPDLCPAGQDDQPTSYCTIVEWIRRERAAALAAGLVSSLADGDTVPIIYVDRPANPDRLIDFANYRGGAQLMRVDATVGLYGALTGFGAPTAIDLSGCNGAADYDVRGPEISHDATRMVFALRAGDSDGLNIYESDLDGANCTQLTTDGGQTDSGVPIHNFDPVFAPDNPEHNPGGAIVFASTRPGKLGRSHVSPHFRLPSSNLWRMQRDGSALEQVTFLTGSELSPAFMQKGQLTMTTEKATQTFYQLSGRRINWDLTDYHPLMVQRDSIGYQQGTEIRESLDRDFLVILSNANSGFAGGALGQFNRSIGPFEAARANEPAYAPSLTVYGDPAAGTGGSNGAYRSPFAAPDGSILVSFAPGNVDVTNSGSAVDFDLVVFDPVTGTTQTVAGGGDGRFQVEGVIAYRRSSRHVFMNIPELVFGGDNVAAAAMEGVAWAHFPDLPMVATLLTKQNRGDRQLGAVDGDTIAVYEAAAPPQGGGDGDTFQNWTLLGTKPLEADGSVFIKAPSGVPLILEVRQGSSPLLTMTEEHQFGPGELTSLGIHRDFFDGVCGGCHGSVEGPELDVVVNLDALTAASLSLARPSRETQPGSL